jgi:GST-like protein
LIELYGMSSPNVLKIVIMLEETGLPYRFRYVNVAAGEQFSADFLALSPAGKVPLIVDHEGPAGSPYAVFESGAILLYLAEKTGALLATTATARYDALQWLMLQVGGVGPLFGQLTHFVRFAPEGNEYSLSRYRTLAGRLYDMLNTRLAASPYVAGDSYSIADVAIFPWVSLYHKPHGMAWDDHPQLKRWCESVGDRPAVARAAAKYDVIQAEDPSMKPGASLDDLDRFFGRGKHTRAPVRSPFSAVPGLPTASKD